PAGSVTVPWITPRSIEAWRAALNESPKTRVVTTSQNALRLIFPSLNRPPNPTLMLHAALSSGHAPLFFRRLGLLPFLESPKIFYVLRSEHFGHGSEGLANRLRPALPERGQQRRVFLVIFGEVVQVPGSKPHHV